MAGTGLARPLLEAFLVMHLRSSVPYMCSLFLNLSLLCPKRHTADRLCRLSTGNLSNSTPAAIVTGMFSVKLADADAASGLR